VLANVAISVSRSVLVAAGGFGGRNDAALKKCAQSLMDSFDSKFK
jgi:thiamine pyrophosphokinase